ncbi:hypothetical protein ACQ4PT_062781 [Festuca glaucescens]
MARSAGGPLNQPLRQPILSRTTPGRHGGSIGKVDDGLKDGAAVGTGTAGNPEVQPTTNLPVSRFDAGSSSNQGGRMEGWHTDGFRGQGFGNFEEGFFEGNNGYGNGYGAMSRGRFSKNDKNNKVPVPGTDMFLVFEEWSASDLDPFSLTEVWVKVHGCCYKERCDYLSLFAVGSLIGKTKEVDMKFTRSHSEVRMKVEVTRAEFIPTTTVDHTYDGAGYGLLFKPEDGQIKIKSDVVMQEANMDDDANGKEDKEEDSVKDANLAPLGGVDKNSSGQQNPPNTSSIPNLKAHCSMPMVRVGLIDCTDPPHSNFYFVLKVESPI